MKGRDFIKAPGEVCVSRVAVGKLSKGQRRALGEKVKKKKKKRKLITQPRTKEKFPERDNS